jgi:two-component system response regulator VicR
MAVKCLLEAEGFEVTTAYDGLECLERLKKEKPGLLIIDYLMPHMNGMVLCEKIRKNKDLKSTKVMFFSVAQQSLVGKENLRKTHVLDYIKKPFNNEDLVRRVKHVVNGGGRNV